MLTEDEKILQILDKEDKEKLLYFAKLLLKQNKYKMLKDEIELRREEIRKGETLIHDDIWDDMDV